MSHSVWGREFLFLLKDWANLFWMRHTRQISVLAWLHFKLFQRSDIDKWGVATPVPFLSTCLRQSADRKSKWGQCSCAPTTLKDRQNLINTFHTAFEYWTPELIDSTVSQFVSYFDGHIVEWLWGDMCPTGKSIHSQYCEFAHRPKQFCECLKCTDIDSYCWTVLYIHFGKTFTNDLKWSPHKCLIVTPSTKRSNSIVNNHKHMDASQSGRFYWLCPN